MIGTALSLLAVAVAGCGAQDHDALVLSSDPGLASLATELLPDLVRRSGMELREPLRIERRSREQLVAYLEYKLNEELPREEAEAVVEAYALFGLVDPDLDLRAVLMGLYVEQVAGFYEPDSTALFVMDDQPESELEALLIHELVHAVQDQTADLDALTDPDLGNDRAAAAHAAIEGHATLVMLEYMLEQQVGSPVNLNELPGFGTMLRQNLSGVREQFPALASAPLILQESLIFPYVEGAAFLLELWGSAGRVVPFGEHLPLSTEQILGGAGEGAPIDVGLDVTGGTVLHEDVLGRLELGVLLDQHLGVGRSALAEGWEGDRYALIEGEGGARSLTAVILWDAAAARDRFADAIASVSERFGGPLRIDRVRALGKAAAVLTIGPADGVVVRAGPARRP